METFQKRRNTRYVERRFCHAQEIFGQLRYFHLTLCSSCYNIVFTWHFLMVWGRLHAFWGLRSHFLLWTRSTKKLYLFMNVKSVGSPYDLVPYDIQILKWNALSDKISQSLSQWDTITAYWSVKNMDKCSDDEVHVEGNIAVSGREFRYPGFQLCRNLCCSDGNFFTV